MSKVEERGETLKLSVNSILKSQSLFRLYA